MGSSVRSIFGRAPLAIPPPVVCWVHPIGIIDPTFFIEPEPVGQHVKHGEGARVESTVDITFNTSKPGLPFISIMRGRFWLPGQVPSEPEESEAPEEVPFPFPPMNATVIISGVPRRIIFGTRLYDEVVHLRFTYTAGTRANKYVDLGRIFRAKGK